MVSSGRNLAMPPLDEAMNERDSVGETAIELTGVAGSWGGGLSWGYCLVLSLMLRRDPGVLQFREGNSC